ncbi:HAD-IA family hydrolase [Brucella sp. 10RB9214]|uniref:HAD family hydrolase n=1 Tax=unclassified Brucella TaxID=2632610 RepID=UPI000972ACB7|nr:HAD family hydrolase [Brucella sp. 09RB8910]APY13032.1 glycerol-3-phosphatase [Brucella sp. 09RB8910]MRN47024.1 HAD-IA family hydrolase [Brucella sp. 10RB9212]MRN50418.1 HAD-IA family hydrolase [Brucella sp. 10RB9214]
MTSFSPFGKSFDAFLFDMDGTILSSIAATERVWSEWAKRHGIDPVTFLPTIHGVRAVETVRRLALPGVDPIREAEILLEAEMADLDGIAPIEGAYEFLYSLPENRWAIVTSAPLELARRRIKAAGLPMPKTIVSAEDVERGKPSPECFELGAKRLGFAPRDCLVFEDAPAGIVAGETAGASVVVVTATHPHSPRTSHLSIESYRYLQLTIEESGKLSLSPTVPASVG